MARTLQGTGGFSSTVLTTELPLSYFLKELEAEMRNYLLHKPLDRWVQGAAEGWDVGGNPEG